MSGAWAWIAAVLAVGVAVAGWRWAQRRTAVHDEWLHSVLLGDREVQRIRQQFRQEARARQE